MLHDEPNDHQSPSESFVANLSNVSKAFEDGDQRHQVFESVDFRLSQGQSVALTGASGSGKSTLLNLIAGFEPIDSGQLTLLNQSVQRWNDDRWSDFRLRHLGVIFQQFNLLTPLNVKQNIAFSLQLNGRKWDDWCDHLCDKLGLDTLLHRHVSNLSGGQQQRVAIARALSHKPALLLADEPTGNLDEQSGLEVMSLISGLAHQSNSAVLLVTHSQQCADFMQQQYHLEKGSLHVK
ncbi:ABC transporter ATP-binding protein [Vibrio sp. qd031]|uniref:ABC transporter ATP-binding protein n=1 Tax=Vibrio sp. qd031 TaxID=1603038 RepID=UPI000A0FCAB6|nr:ABC transporter ATP-binding protein [Vibrio sp. qd031]